MGPTAFESGEAADHDRDEWEEKRALHLRDCKSQSCTVLFQRYNPVTEGSARPHLVKALSQGGDQAFNRDMWIQTITTALLCLFTSEIMSAASHL